MEFSSGPHPQGRHWLRFLEICLWLPDSSRTLASRNVKPTCLCNPAAHSSLESAPLSGLHQILNKEITLILKGTAVRRHFSSFGFEDLCLDSFPFSRHAQSSEWAPQRHRVAFSEVFFNFKKFLNSLETQLICFPLSFCLSSSLSLSLSLFACPCLCICLPFHFFSGRKRERNSKNVAPVDMKEQHMAHACRRTDCVCVCVHVGIMGGEDLECGASDGRRQPGLEISIFFLYVCLETLPKVVMITMQGSGLSSGLM